MKVMNVDVWFREPLSWHQLISWPLLVISAGLAIVVAWKRVETGCRQARM